MVDTLISLVKFERMFSYHWSCLRPYLQTLGRLHKRLRALSVLMDYLVRKMGSSMAAHNLLLSPPIRFAGSPVSVETCSVSMANDQSVCVKKVLVFHQKVGGASRFFFWLQKTDG